LFVKGSVLVSLVMRKRRAGAFRREKRNGGKVGGLSPVVEGWVTGLRNGCTRGGCARPRGGKLKVWARGGSFINSRGWSQPVRGACQLLNYVRRESSGVKSVARKATFARPSFLFPFLFTLLYSSPQSSDRLLVVFCAIFAAFASSSKSLLCLKQQDVTGADSMFDFDLSADSSPISSMVLTFERFLV